MKIIDEIKNPCSNDLFEILRNKLESFGFKEQGRPVGDNTIIFLRTNCDESEEYFCFHTNNLSIETDNLCFTIPYTSIDALDLSDSSIKFHYGSIRFQLKR